MNITRAVMVAMATVFVCFVLLAINGLVTGADWNTVASRVAPVVAMIAFLGFVVGGLTGRD